MRISDPSLIYTLNKQASENVSHNSNGIKQINLLKKGVYIFKMKKFSKRLLNLKSFETVLNLKSFETVKSLTSFYLF